jgi:hypothetical protein
MEGSQLGNVSSGEDDLRAIYGVRFILPRQNFSARLWGQDRVEGMIFGFSDPDEGKILGFSKEKPESVLCSSSNNPARIFFHPFALLWQSL